LVRIPRAVISSVTACALAASVICPSPGSAWAAAELSRADYEDCQARDEVTLKAAIATISTDALKAGVKSVDYRALVAEQWRRNGVDALLDKRVDLAIDEVKNETSWSELIKSLGNSETSQKLATTVAERVYRSDAVKVALEDMAAGVAREVGKTIEFASVDSAGPLLTCLKAFIGPRYGSAVAAAVAGDAGKDLNVDPSKGGGEVSAGSVLKQTSGGLAGATILIVRRQLANLATRVGQRVVGSVLSRLVSVAAGGVGLVLIAKDLWELRNGVLPIIATEMKAKATKDKVQEEIAATLAEQVGEHVKEIGSASADHVIEIWQGFKRAHALVLKIAEQNSDFRTFLDSVKPDALPRLDEVVALLVAEEGESGMLKRLGDGSLNEAVHVMPAKALDIARETKSVAAALAWSSIAGDKLDSVLDYEIHKRAAPADFTRASLERVLSLEDRTAVTRIAAVPRVARDALFSLETAELRSLAKSLSETELTTLASYLNGLQPGPRELVLRTVAADPSRMQVLASSHVRDAIIASADQGAAVNMMLQRVTAFAPRTLVHDLDLAWRGRVSPRLLWDKHPAGIAFSALLAGLLGLWLKRLFRPRRTAAAAVKSS
jgi:hypothetical protein